MTFFSLKFIIFYAIIFFTYYIIPNKYRWIPLLVGSYFFYILSSTKNTVILFTVTLISYFFGIKIESLKSESKRKLCLALCIAINIASLFIFKYFNFFSPFLEKVLMHLGVPYNIPKLHWSIPLGISFYTLQIIAYLIDVYRGNIKAEKHFGYFATYVCFFLTVISGPIERGTTLLQNLKKERKFDYTKASLGCRTILIGLSKKIIIADQLSKYINGVYGNVQKYNGETLLLASFLFAIQLYCDFSGYTDIAVGCARILGIELTENFNLPYFSKSIQEFWRRWHISLSSWLKDYLYIPLGGNRVSKLRGYINILIIFLVSGVWHGTTLNFAVWGLLHGVYQVIGKLTKNFKLKALNALKIQKDWLIVKIPKMIITFFLVDFAWIFFRANSLNQAIYIVRKILTIRFHSIKFASIPDSSIKYCLIITLTLLILSIIDAKISLKNLLLKINIVPRWLIYYTLIFIILFFSLSGSTQFIYAQF